MTTPLSRIDWHICHEQQQFNVYVDDQFITSVPTRLEAELAVVEYVQDLIDQGLIPSQFQLDQERDGELAV